jgi:putative PIN family toxin of toxin-antitoxin system
VKIVLDTTILVRSNEHSRGLARELLPTIIGSKHQLLLSTEMLCELARVLRYPLFVLDGLRAFYNLSENMIFDYINFLRHASEIVTLDPLVAASIRNVNDIAVMQTAIIGEADPLCTRDEDFFEHPAGEYLRNMGISVVDDISLMHRLRF